MSVRRAFLILLLLVPPLAAQQTTAPQNDSIRKEDLKADLFFVAHDLTQGRLVGTPGNAARRRIHQIAVRAPGPRTRRAGRVVFPDLQPDDRGDSAPTTAWKWSTRIRSRPVCSRDRTSIRSGSAPAARVNGPVVFAGFGITAPHAVSTTITAATRQGQDRAGARPRAGRARPEQPVRRRRHVRAADRLAQGAGGAGEGRRRRAVRHRRPQPSRRRRTSRRRRAGYWPPKPPRI